jgi:hypothetical protein
VRFDVLTAVKMTMFFFWVVTPASLHGVTTQNNIVIIII